METCSHIRGLESVKNEAMLTPRMWSCVDCGTTESVWACLQCNNIACGRFIEEHGLKHFNDKGHPLALEVNKKYLFCYICDSYVFNDNCYGEIALLRETLKEIETQVFNESLTRSGCVIRGPSTLRIHDETKSEKEHAKMEDKQYTAVCHWRLSLLSKVFSALVKHSKEEKLKVQSEEKQTEEKKEEPPKKRRKVIIPGVTGLRNLGNTCYMNSVLQVLSHLQFFRHCFLLLHAMKSPPDPPCLTSTPKNRRSISAIYTRQTTVECYEHVSMPLRKEQSWPTKKKTHINSLLETKIDDNSNEVSANHSSLNESSDSGEQNKKVFFSDELHALFRVMWSGKWAIVTPLAVLHAVWKLIPSFLGYSQHDAQEFLCEVLERLQSELEGDYEVNFQSPITDDVIHPKDILPNVFEGKLVSEVMCHNCHNVSKCCEQFWDLSLEFPNRYQVQPRSSRGRVTARRPSMDSCHLTELLSKFTQLEILEGKTYRCEKCLVSSPDSLQFAQKQLQIAELPEILRLHLKRFRWYCQTRGKIVSHVQFDMKLDMKPYCHELYFESYTDEDFVYKLSGVIIHMGTGFDAGHYVAYCWNEQAGSWVYYNDARVSLCSENEVLKSQAYILLYTRCNGRSNLYDNLTLPKSP
ncbi:ubiquitin carboxyl-terminal hydrolase 44-like [Dendronephthya gigantea]|uniref:ubiquitin carboxyl-terminal hydrolase 44-like n=1 Tax=Dendronephthya gigantea TaxID=151771 RepID=UPI00106DB82B|nr:ubiquitin carboxyl-terminal hydrolase 44-like [Dendronephthya gigantea]